MKPLGEKTLLELTSEELYYLIHWPKKFRALIEATKGDKSQMEDKTNYIPPQFFDKLLEWTSNNTYESLESADVVMMYKITKRAFSTHLTFPPNCLSYQASLLHQSF